MLLDKIKELKLCNSSLLSNLEGFYKGFGLIPLGCSFLYWSAFGTALSTFFFIAAIFNVLLLFSNRFINFMTYALSKTLFRKICNQREKLNLFIMSILKEMLRDIENGNTININNLWATIQLKEYLENNGIEDKCSNTLRPEIDKILNSYNNHIKSYKHTRGVHEVKLNFGKKGQSIYVTSEEIKDLFTKSLTDITLTDFVEGKIDYKSEAIVKNINILLTVENINNLNKKFTRNNIGLIQFLIFIKDFSKEESVKDLIAEIVGPQLFSTNINRTVFESAPKTEIEKLIDIIALNLSKMTREQQVQFSALKRDYSTASQLGLVHDPECERLLKDKFNSLLNDHQEDEKTQQEKFIRYLKKVI